MRFIRLVLAAAGGLALTACDSTRIPTAARDVELQAALQSSAPIAILQQTFARQTGTPNIETVTFAASAGALYVVDLDDLGSIGADGSAVLNGDTLLAPRTGDAGARHLTTTISLDALNTLVVRLLGKPGSVLQVTVSPVKPVTLDAVTFTSPTTMQIGGPGATFNTTITNHTPAPLIGIAVQAWVVQGTARRAAGGALISCNADLGVLPPGPCTRVGDGVYPSNAAAGIGTLVAGSATAIVQVVQLDGGSTVLDSLTVPITLTATSLGDLWTVRAAMPTARRLLAAAEADGRIYTFGGCGSDCTALLEHTRVEAYDPGTDGWEIRAPMPVDFVLGAAAAPGNGRIYVVGGMPNGTGLQEYDPGTDSWVPKSPMPTARYGLAAVAVNGKIYAIGGDGPSNAVEEYDPATDSWTAKAPMPTPRLLLAAAVLNGKIYAMGGSPDALGNTQTNVVEVYDPADNTWTARAPLPTAIQVSASAAVNGRVYVFGGFVVCCAVGNATLAYDPSLDLWTAEAPLPTPRDEAPAVLVNGAVYVIGGADAGRNALAVNERYTP